jgi:hypothetical protein
MPAEAHACVRSSWSSLYDFLLVSALARQTIKTAEAASIHSVDS